jgi:antitoxin (DNA-binding transcriptional repressor) of toxin-antitoxin stability system
LIDGDRPVAKLVGIPKPRRKLGMMKGTGFSMAPDFDAPLDEFKEDMS